MGCVSHAYLHRRTWQFPAMVYKRNANANKKRSTAMKGNKNASKAKDAEPSTPRVDEPSTPRVRSRATVPGRGRGRPPNSECSAEELQRRKERREQQRAEEVPSPRSATSSL